MKTSDKRYPALGDNDPMPFGKWKGTPMMHVPASYLYWLHCEKCTNKEVANYIHNSWDDIAKEMKLV